MTILLDGTNGVTTAGITLGSTAIASTGAEINILDGVTSTAAVLNILDGVTSTTAELNILDGVTSTTAELNILDGVTSTAAELNILDGVTTTAAEINLIDGGTARGTTAVADGDGVLINDAGTMRMTTVDTLATYVGTKVGGGKVLQVVNVLDSTSRTGSNGALIIAVQASITPSSTSSKIAMFGSAALKYAGGGEIQMHRNYGVSGAAQLGEDQYFAPNEHQDRRLYAFHFYDSPNTTSARTYTITFDAGGTHYTNYNNSQSVMFLMEIDNA